ncbi:hypothetical protein WOLCODRAFT_18296 [Wolfiporia cocos MD-104 SS10]|uniref:F-box domain-containing protein n=1 Tax=Wolfiporia cocos (strain MD-104) TaxID=742152 RepID=A0A2H3K2P4_WOLCO|nr:hypothetical protein WOLCODRAFT_18296 [Wolfiporia cocos MD-104 SS10]
MSNDQQRSSPSQHRLVHYKPLSDGNCPIERMPNAILACIFGFVLCHPVYDWCIGRVMVVCRRWNDIAMHTPQLWTDIAVDEARRASDISLYLERSARLPIYIYVKNGTQTTFENLVRCSSRIKELYCFFNKSSDLSCLGALHDPAPVLESLSIHFDNYSTDATDAPRDVAANPAIPSTIFNHQAPNLRKLTLNPFVPTLGCNLTHLRLECQNGTTWNMNRFMTLLQANPSLEELHMFDASPAPVSQFSGFVDLPKLRVWSLGCHDCTELSRILQCVGIPSTAQLIISDLEEAGSSISDSFPQDISKLRNLGVLTDVHITVESGMIKVLALPTNGTAALRFTTCGSLSYFVHTSQNIGKILSVAHLTHLSISTGVDSAFWFRPTQRELDEARDASLWEAMFSQVAPRKLRHMET